jgi:hypothetical protein
MKDIYHLGLLKDKEKLKEDVYYYLNKTTIGYKPILSNLIDCIYDIQESKTFTENHLSILEIGLKQPLELVFCDYSGKYICELSNHFDKAKELILKLANDSQSKIRFNMVTLMLYNPPSEIIDEVLINGLKDKSFKIREKSADIIWRLAYKQAYKYLDEQVVLEENKEYSRKIKFYRDLAIDGYILEGYELTVSTKNGGFIGKTVKENELVDLKAIINQMKNKS